MLQEHRDEVFGLLSRETADWRVEQDENAANIDKVEAEASPARRRPQNTAVRVGDDGQSLRKQPPFARFTTTPDGSPKLPPIALFQTLNANSNPTRSPRKR